ncbi:hypothetical protein HCJ39_11335 [Listeria rocourtiae]|uniref:helix-turn-helix domain-containing protein n=1 Tax=Listeria rocourtiae TaxID=647910 RepID=UPI00162A2AE9|nr:helix-turn-helix domain-containing protein [Listeria rocourtiae]MBC1436007.1 hypothetical protein [Listeria rocourtiae]MBC1605309.1 hypothetical protein [Listeria rocourtiae]
MKYVVPATAYRRLSLLNMLFFASEPLSKNNVVKSLETSMNTLNADIAALNEIFPEDISQIEEGDRRLSLHISDTINFDYLAAYMISTSDLYQLSLSTFWNTPLNVKEWSEKHFISLTALYVKLKEVDTFLAESRLILNTSPLRIQGNEVNIRFFYFHLFTRCYPYSGWIMEEFYLKYIDNFIQKIEKYSNIHFSESSRLEYTIAIGVALTRVKQGYCINLEENLTTWENLSPFYNVLDIDFSDLEYCLGFNLELGDRYNIFQIFFLTTFSYITRKQIQLRIQYDAKFYSARYKLAKELVALLDKNAIDYELVLVQVLDYLMRFNLIDKTNLILDIDYFSTKYPSDSIKTSDIEAILSKYENLVTYKYVKDNKSTILKYLHDFFSVVLINAASSKKLYVKVISKRGFMWEEYMKMIIRKYYSEDLVIFCDELQPTEHFLQYDLIISDSQIFSPNDKPIIIWSMPPAIRDIEKLKRWVAKKSNYPA